MGIAGTAYHIALGIAVMWVAVSGFMIFLRIRRRQGGVLPKSGDQKVA